MFIYICLALVALVAIAGAVLSVKADEGPFLGLCVGATLGLALTLVASMIAVPFMPKPDHRYAVGAECTPIKSLASSSSVHGDFFLGTGVVDGKRVINYVTQEPGGGMTLRQVDAATSYIYEDGRECMSIDHHWDEWPAFVPWRNNEFDMHVFHVPRGSVASDFVITNH